MTIKCTLLFIFNLVVLKLWNVKTFEVCTGKLIDFTGLRNKHEC